MTKGKVTCGDGNATEQAFSDTEGNPILSLSETNASVSQHNFDFDNSGRNSSDSTDSLLFTHTTRQKEIKKIHPLEKASTTTAIWTTLTNPRFYFLGLCVACLNTIMEVDKYMPLYLHVALGYDRAQAAQFAAIYPLSQLIAMVVASMYFDNLSRRAKHLMFLGLTMLY